MHTNVFLDESFSETKVSHCAERLEIQEIHSQNMLADSDRGSLCKMPKKVTILRHDLTDFGYCPIKKYPSASIRHTPYKIPVRKTSPIDLVLQSLNFHYGDVMANHRSTLEQRERVQSQIHSLCMKVTCGEVQPCVVTVSQVSKCF